MVKFSAERENWLILASEAVMGMFLRSTRDPEMEISENETPVLPSRPLARVLVRPVRLFGECPMLVLHKRRAKYGGDWPVRRVELEKTSTLQIRI